MGGSRRRRDPEGSRARLLAAATELFSTRGFDRTTTRDIGRLADVDPTLIARYFGSKTQLYITTLHGDDTEPIGFLDADRLRQLLHRAFERGPGPVYHSAVTEFDDAEATAASREALRTLFVDPVVRQLRAAGISQADLRSEILTAALVGIVLSRRAGALSALTSAHEATVIELVAALLGAVNSDSD